MSQIRHTIKIIQHTLLLLAWTIMFMHNLTPHTHGDDSTAETTIGAVEDDGDNIFDWMQGLFAQDLGEGHLEHCVSPDDVQDGPMAWDLHQPIGCIIGNDSPDVSSPIIALQVKPPLITHPTSRIAFLHLPRRAPPVIV